MIPLVETMGRDLFWVRTKVFSRRHVLLCQGQAVAMLAFQGWLHRQAVAETAEGRFLLESVGWVGREVVVRDADSSRDVARFRGGWLGAGRLTFENGDEYFWRATHFWGWTWAFTGENGDPLVIFHSRPFALRRECRVQIESEARRITGLPVMIVLGWMLTLATRRRSS